MTILAHPRRGRAGLLAFRFVKGMIKFGVLAIIAGRRDLFLAKSGGLG